uniref:uncharacterized protein LOC122608910 n=1 Tax=Erigeron canadensis TaxID=72917 RepID=UPI001CB9019B|nr:uncharacterized protein LOC122608910 [Erigeron canadensis]
MQSATRCNNKRTREISKQTTGPSTSRNVAYTGEQSRRQASRRASILNNNFRVSSSEQESSSSNPLGLNVGLHSQSTDQYLLSPEYIDIGDCTNVCQYCGALFWFDKRALSTPSGQCPVYIVCCKRGAVSTQFPVDPPDTIRRLFQDNHFMNNIRAYNSMFSMTSFGAKVDESVNQGNGPYVFKVTGQISHWLGSLCPLPGERPRLLQMYIFGSENEVSNRLSAFSLHHAMSYLLRLHDYDRLKNYGLPTPGTLGAIVTDEGSASEDFDIVVRSKDNTPHRVSKLHPAYMPLQYPLLFPHAEQGWSPTLRLADTLETSNRNLTMNMLYQQYLVDAYVSIEHERLDYVRRNQNDLRCEFLQGVYDALSTGDVEGREIGKRVILPASFTGGPRYMYQHYQDALAICRVHKNPQYFITFTCNVKWREIQRKLSKTNATPLDRPNIVVRVFQLKVKSFMNYLKTSQLFGAVTAEVYTIEFQKRGLPHCHILLWVSSEYIIRDATDLDKYICAELPNQSIDPVLYRIVTDSMLHGPCGLAKTNASCMFEGHCSKSFPKPYESVTRFDSHGYVHYKRRRTGDHFIKAGIPLDNGFVVPYNEDLCRHFDAHINVEYCGWSMLIKYLFKYISKGVNRVKYQISSHSASTSSENPERSSNVVNEIDNFLDGRFVCPHEAVWRILNFPIHHRHPPVQILVVHLEGKQTVSFRASQKLSNVVRNPALARTTLTEWLANNRRELASNIPREQTGLDLKYTQYPSQYTWHGNTKSWIRRATNRVASVSRLVYVYPTCGNLFYLRLLLTHQVGCTSFEDIRTVAGVTYDSYRLACEKLGLIGDDREWSQTLSEASNWATSPELRSLFIHMLLFCEISNPLALWTDHWQNMGEDIIYQLSHVSSASSSIALSCDIREYILYELELLLKSNSESNSLSDFGLPLPTKSSLSPLTNRLLLEEKTYDREALCIEHTTLHSALNSEQLHIYNHVCNNLNNSSQILLFIYGHGGSGKTFLWKTIISALRSTGKIVLAVAASGIASLLLPGGRTAHSRFKIPLDLTEESTCHIKKTLNFRNFF